MWLVFKEPQLLHLLAVFALPFKVARFLPCLRVDQRRFGKGVIFFLEDRWLKMEDGGRGWMREDRKSNLFSIFYLQSLPSILYNLPSDFVP